MRFYQWVKRCRVVNLLQNNSHLKDAINSCRTPVHTELFFFIIRRQVYFLLFFSLIIPSGFHECNIATKLSKNKVSKDWFPLIPNLLHDLKQWIPDIKEFGLERRSTKASICIRLSYLRQKKDWKHFKQKMCLDHVATEVMQLILAFLDFDPSMLWKLAKKVLYMWHSLVQS